MCKKYTKKSGETAQRINPPEEWDAVFRLTQGVGGGVSEFLGFLQTSTSPPPEELACKECQRVHGWELLAWFPPTRVERTLEGQELRSEQGSLDTGGGSASQGGWG